MALTLASLISTSLVAASSSASSVSSSPTTTTTSSSEVGCGHFRGVFGEGRYYRGAGGVAGPNGVGLVEDGFIRGSSEIHVSNLVADDGGEGPAPDPQHGVGAAATGKWRGFLTDVM